MSRAPRPSRALFGAFGALALALACGKTTDSGGTGATTPQCSAPTTDCGGSCVDLATDASHCGSCGKACPVGDGCVDGVCQGTGCPAEQSTCGGMCVALASNPLNCGDCNTACAALETCVDGACACEPPLQTCGGVCTDVQTSAAHCGSCDSPCGADEQCVGGVCTSLCAAGSTYCTDHCVDLETDVSACGSCDAPCRPNEVCDAGTCRCPLSECGGACVDVSSDGENCGACGTACPAGERCTDGVCSACSSDFFFCPSTSGDPLQTCLEQARTASMDAGGDANPGPSGPDLACQCQNCLVELQDCLSDGQCVSTWQCAVRNTCTEACWGSMGVCSTGTTSTGCFKWCAPSTGSTQTATRAEALLRCTIDSGCGI